jgi:hypothetical protein
LTISTQKQLQFGRRLVAGDILLSKFESEHFKPIFVRRKKCFCVRPQKELGTQVANPQIAKERLAPQIANQHIATLAEGPQI